MTVTVKKQKFQDTLDVCKNNAFLEKNYTNIWFFLLTVEPVSPSVKISSPNIKYITLFDMVSMVLNKDSHFQKKFIDLLKSEYASYFSYCSLAENSFSISDLTPVPTDLMLFNEFVSTDDWFPDNPGEGYLEVFNFIEGFQKKLSKCTYRAREILVSIIKLACPPIDKNERIIVYADALLGSLNIDDNFCDFKYHYDYLELNGLVEKIDDYQGMYIVNDEIHIDNRAKFELNYCIYEPEFNMFSALFIFYLDRYCLNDFERAILNCDFSMLSDNLC